MKILLTTDSYTHMTNGVSLVVATLANAYREKGHDVRVLTISGDRKAHQDGTVYYMPSFEVPLYPDLRMSLVHRHPYIKEIRNWAPDVVHIHSEASTARIGKAIAKAVGAPVVMTWHTDYAKYLFHKHHSLGVVKLVAKRLMAIMYSRTTIITVPSYKAKNILDGYGLKHPNTVIPNGIMLERFYQDFTPEQRKALLKQHNIDENKKILIIISRLSAEKNISELIEFFPALVEKDPDLHLVIAGTGPDEKHLHNLTEKLGMSEHITFVGFVKPEETYRYYKLGVVFLSASTFEMHSLTYLEAMACGLPLICRNDPCLQDVLTDGFNGYIYNTQEEFTEKALKLLQNESLRKEMAKNSLQRSMEFSEDALADRMLNLYSEICEEYSKSVKKK